jgi:hypothetical protein
VHPNSMIPKPPQQVKECGSMSNRCHEMHHPPIATISSPNQMSLKSGNDIDKSTIHKSLQQVKEYESMSIRCHKTHNSPIATISSLNQRQLRTVKCIHDSMIHKSFQQMTKSRNEFHNHSMQLSINQICKRVHSTNNNHTPTKHRAIWTSIHRRIHCVHDSRPRRMPMSMSISHAFSFTFRCKIQP